MSQSSLPRANTPQILIFDSGVGGLSILQHARVHTSHCQYHYLSDNDGFPYGNKPDEQVIQRTVQCLQAFYQRQRVDIIVIACNTASTVALPFLRQHFSIPIIGVVPAIKPAAALSSNKYIGLLATPGTIARDYTHQLISDFASDCTLVSQGSSELVELAEQKLRGETVDRAKLQHILRPFLLANNANPTPEKLDHLVLACTHFPLLRDEIQAIMGPKVTLIDSGAAIARRIHYWLGELAVPYQGELASENCAYFTRADAKLDSLRPALERRGLQQLIVLKP